MSEPSLEELIGADGAARCRELAGMTDADFAAELERIRHETRGLMETDPEELSTMVDKPVARAPKPRTRRTRADMDALRSAVVRAVEIDAPTTCRSVFYRLVSMGFVEKTEREYKNAVVRLLTELRRSGVVPWSAITDGTRLRRKRASYGSLGQALDQTRDFYRRDLWRDAPVYVEVWTEKDAISGVLFDVTDEWDVPLMICRGYPSQTFLHNAAGEIEAQGKPAFVYYFGDHDPSGRDIRRHVEKHLREYTTHAEIHFESLAVTADQIRELELPTRPTKKTDSRSRKFKGESVEVDAIPPETLRGIASRAIVQHIDKQRFLELCRVEQAEREVLAALADRWRAA